MICDEPILLIYKLRFHMNNQKIRLINNFVYPFLDIVDQNTTSF